jgi:hypothetical protein
VENRKRPWTDEDDRRLLELRAAGRSALSISVALRRTASAVAGRISILRQREKKRFRVHLGMKPMTTFDPAQPAILHDRFADNIETWTGEDAHDYRENALMERDGTVEWRGFVFDGWSDVLGG